MTEERTPAEPEPEQPQSGVFAKLPDSRPGTRSPRRAGVADGRGGAPSAAKRQTPAQRSRRRRKTAGPAGAPSARATASRAREATASGAAPRSQGPPRTREPREQSAGGIEDVAWAGIAAAAEAATIGVRLASRAIEALRGNPGRS